MSTKNRFKLSIPLWNRRRKSSHLTPTIENTHRNIDATDCGDDSNFSFRGCLPSIHRKSKKNKQQSSDELSGNDALPKSEYDDVLQHLTIPKRYIDDTSDMGGVDIDCCDSKLSLQLCESDSVTTLRGESESNISNISTFDTPPPHSHDCMSTVVRHPLRIIFLDIDGVLRSLGSGYQFSDAHLLRLKRILDSIPFVRVVLSSSWRLHNDAKKFLFQQLSTRVNIDIDYYFLGQTPHFHNLLSRSYEILNYVDILQSSPKYQLLNWIAIDDLPLNRMGATQITSQFSDHFLKTNGKTGLTDDDCTSIIEKLLSNDSIVGSTKQPNWCDFYHNSNARLSLNLPTTDENLQY